MVGNTPPKKRIVLIGASIGEMWDFSNLSKRIGNTTFEFESIAEYSADKGGVLNDIISRTDGKPDYIIFKECASYFKADEDNYDPKYISEMKSMIKDWVSRCFNNNISPILSTAVPITKVIPIFPAFKRYLKKYILLRPQKKMNRAVRLQGICDFNDWIRLYALEKNILILDLESVLRISERLRFLNPEYSTDGLHLNRKGYAKLDLLMSQLLNNLN